MEYISRMAMFTLTQRIHMVRWGDFSRVFGWILFLAILPTGLSPAKAVPALDELPRPKLLWQVDLRSFGYEAPAEKFYREGFPDSFIWPSPIWFVNDNQFVATFLTRRQIKELSRRRSAGALWLEAIFLDTTTGNVKNTASWPVTSPTAGIVTIVDGKLVVRTGEEIVLYSSELEPLKKLTPPFDDTLLAQYERWRWTLYASPTGRSILSEYLMIASGSSEYLPYGWINSETLETTHSWSEKIRGRKTISDYAIVHSLGVFDHTRKIWIRNLGESWKVFCAPPGCGEPVFLNDEMLVMYDLHKIQLVDTNGRVLFTQDFAYADWLKSPVPSANGQRFAPDSGIPIMAPGAWR